MLMTWMVLAVGDWRIVAVVVVVGLVRVVVTVCLELGTESTRRVIQIALLQTGTSR